MTRLEDMMNKIGSDNKVPNRIWEKLDYALDTLPDHEKDHAPGQKTGESRLPPQRYTVTDCPCS